MISYILALTVGALVLGIDQYTKYIVLQRLVMFEYHPILGDLFGLMYIDNPGMAWGMLPNKQIVFLIFSIPFGLPKQKFLKAIALSNL